MTEWTTPEQIAAARTMIGDTIPGYQPPVVWAVGMTSATSSSEHEFPVVNVRESYLAAVILAKTLGYANGTETFAVSPTELRHALDGAAPGAAYEAARHVNLEAWREMLAEVETNPYRSLVAVFVGDLDDPVSSAADGSLRTQLPG